jgi:4-amino-4-deoxy-L-arabinose transferase-like glycosyltransferase
MAYTRHTFAARSARDFSRAPPTLPYVNWASWRVALAGALVAALTTLPGLGGGTLWDNSETAYGEVAREILISHDWIVMHLNGQAWFVQPPLYFWIAAAFARVFGVSEFALRLPSALATIAMAAAVGYVVGRLASPRAALLSAVILSTSLMQAVLGRLAIMDAMLDLAVAVAILAWFGALQTGERRWWYVGWASLALGTLAKGPVAPAMALLVVVPWAVWNRAVRGAFVMPSVARFLGGFGLFALIVGPWALALYRAAGASAFGEMLGHYTVGRYLGTIENQSGPLYYYVPVVILGFFPWFAYLVPASIEAWQDAANDRTGSLSRLSLVWAIVPFVFFSFAKTKLPNYIALELPALAMLVALWFDRVVDRNDRRAALAWTCVVPLMLFGLGFAVTAFSHDNRLTADLAQIRLDLLALALVILLGAVACFACLLARRTAWAGPFALGGASVAVMLIIALAAAPLVERFKPIPRFASIIDRESRAGDVVAIQSVSGGNALAFYTEPGIVHLDGPDEIPTGPDTDPKVRLCRASRAFVVTSKKRPAPDPTYGRSRRELATVDNDVLFLVDGPPCDPR